MTVAERAYAKVNLVLRVGPRRADGLHQLCSLFASVALCDEVRVEAAGSDTVVCPEVQGENLAAQAVAAFRSLVPDLPPLRVEIDKRIPVAAGLGGGSADAAAVLRAANRLAGGRLDRAALVRLAAGLGSDVPSQIEPCHSIVTGAGEEVEPVELPEMTLVLVPQAGGLSTGAVYTALDKLRSEVDRVPDAALDPERLRGLAAAPLDELAAALENDLQPPALSLRPELERTLAALRRMGALAALVTGSGPTCFGVFPDGQAADAAAAGIDGSLVTEVRRC